GMRLHAPTVLPACTLRPLLHKPPVSAFHVRLARTAVVVAHPPALRVSLVTTLTQARLLVHFPTVPKDTTCPQAARLDAHFVVLAFFRIPLHVVAARREPTRSLVLPPVPFVPLACGLVMSPLDATIAQLATMGTLQE